MKKVTAIILTGILTLGVLTGCQSNSKAEETGKIDSEKRRISAGSDSV